MMNIALFDPPFIPAPTPRIAPPESGIYSAQGGNEIIQYKTK
jgi:hypothetical protein